MQSTHKAQFGLLNATMIWGISFIVLEVVLDYLTPLHAITMRFGIAVLILTIFLLVLKRRDGFSLVTSKTCIILGWLDAFGCLAATIGQKMMTAGLATLLSTSFVFIVPFLAWKVEGTKPHLKMVLLAITALLGIFLISFNGNWKNLSSLSILGILILLGSALFYGIYTVITGKFLNVSNSGSGNIDPLSFLYASLLHTFLPLFLLSMITVRSALLLPHKIIPLLLFLAIFPTLIAFSLYNWAIARMGSVRTSFYLLIQVIVPFLYELIFFQQFYSSWIYSGIFVILISLMVIPQE